ncbi:Signal transduction histidine kinase [Dyadobacter koreensis]|uniref:histidine kinase n=1 Tax=Dyadobacter koreensis TaxID=408657 RepID=A0A1H6PZP2_9BACT|nr:sensor histidine kinase [Dyadobacter koreensis]SEI37078.1 Signal transduction histidine kinase [Dyadobacter koreensis]
METPGELEFTQLLYGGLAFVLFLSLAIVLFILLYQRKLHSQLQKMHDQEIAYQKELTSLVVRSQESERDRISRDLHDEIGVSLSAAKLYINQIQYETSANEMVQLATDASDIIGNIVQDIRQIAQNLSPLILENFGFSQAIQMLLTRIQSGGIRTQCHIDFSTQLDKETELGLYRIVQEATGNALKHANPSLIEVSITQENRIMKLSVSDNGTGFDYQKTASGKSQSMGLSGIKARAGLVNGHLEITSSAQTGTKLELTIPVQS